jgi:hypothetical protein
LNAENILISSGKTLFKTKITLKKQVFELSKNEEKQGKNVELEEDETFSEGEVVGPSIEEVANITIRL